MKLLTVLFLNGVVDSVGDQSVTAELEIYEGCEPTVYEIPLGAFPCDIGEGDVFHLLKEADSTDMFVVCGSFKGER